MHDFLKQFCRKRGDNYILDEFDHEFWLRFDCSIDTDQPELSSRTCDILIVPMSADDWKAQSIRVVANANEHGVLRFLASLGINRFSDKVKNVFYKRTNPLRHGDI